MLRCPEDVVLGPDTISFWPKHDGLIAQCLPHFREMGPSSSTLIHDFNVGSLNCGREWVDNHVQWNGARFPSTDELEIIVPRSPGSYIMVLRDSRFFSWKMWTDALMLPDWQGTWKVHDSLWEFFSGRASIGITICLVTNSKAADSLKECPRK